MIDKAYAVPLHEQLASVPRNARLVIEDTDGMGTRFIPVGRMCHEAAETLRTRLSQCERCGEVNPAEIHTCSPQVCCQEYETCTRPCTPRGREQTKREWQGLTDEEAEHIYAEYWNDVAMFIEAIEAKLKEKNNG